MGIINSTILLIIVILAIIFFVLGLLQFLIRCITKRPTISESITFPDASHHSHALQIQLQQLFRQHDSGVDQSLVEALPVFYYKEIVGRLKSPFDCAICLSEFSDADALKLLVNCSHAFHIHCIETWLMSNSTCPLCRRPIAISSQTHHSSNTEDLVSRNGAEILQENSFPVRLGKFRNHSDESENDDGERSSRLYARRCYSMGAFHYIVGEAELQVTVKTRCENEQLEMDGEIYGGKINVGSRSDSLSVSKIWLWSKKGRFWSSFDDHCSVILPHPTRSSDFV